MPTRAKKSYFAKRTQFFFLHPIPKRPFLLRNRWPNHMLLLRTALIRVHPVAMLPWATI